MNFNHEYDQISHAQLVGLIPHLIRRCQLVTLDNTHCCQPGKIIIVLGLSIHHRFEFDYILNLYLLSMCFVRYRNWIVCTICNAALPLFFRLGKFLMWILAFPLHPRYICYSTMITPDIVEFFKTTRLLPNLLRSLSNFCRLGWIYLSVTLSGKVPYFHSNFHVVTPRTTGCGLCFPATSVSGTVTCIRALWYAVWCMGGWLVLGLQAIIPLI